MRRLTFLFPALLAAGCASTQFGGTGGTRYADALLRPTQAGGAAQGSVTFSQKGDNRVLLTAKLSGLTPGAHGFHIHENPDCSAPDASSAGGHWNPTGMHHGDPRGSEHHLGDLPALEADAFGNASLEVEIPGLSVGSGDGNVIGHSVIVHAAPDDYKTQPAGNSGSRMACGVITAR
ncbi:MAG: superoxide dismutase family protein [Zoogloea sp.]|nr:superoxide dismutase family protein [Zoogloea sp.]